MLLTFPAPSGNTNEKIAFLYAASSTPLFHCVDCQPPKLAPVAWLGLPLLLPPPLPNVSSSAAPQVGQVEICCEGGLHLFELSYELS
jgi:hypothetical protein